MTASLHPRHKWEAVAAGIESEIGGRRPGDDLPSERELADRFGVARMTVRQALDHLSRRGLVRRAHGRGTFVGAAPFTHDQHLVSFSQDMLARGLVPTSRVLANLPAIAPPEVAAALGLGPDEPVRVIERVRLADGIPMAREVASLPGSLVGEIGDTDLATGSLHEILERSFGLRPVRAHQTIGATLLDERSAQLLGLAPRSPAFAIGRVTFDQRDRPIEHLWSRFRGDRYQISFEVTLGEEA